MATSPVQIPDDKARGLARALLRDARFAALAVRDPEDGWPSVSRIALAMTKDGRPMSLISDLSAHARALQVNPSGALLVGEPGEKGDPLTHPRLSLKARARFVRHGEAEHASLAARYLEQRPKAKLYIGFGDFSIVVFSPVSGLLNGGFGKAFALTPGDLLD
ncbi:pyridoxamine 5'-phosphate oxidase family protein [Primorskyibacter aestuariivivens]|uniref:HugZ family pyridoxamine 5'-phosphate oxidase n=1 Tax=Primorskyibacter aestuariivivens TaxID=1888912 RepID=UPI002301DBC0|nr:pyridoxamine 5'-phosphate oxidase family protein [Primorskyibacter aestuariivivens]MDA7428106.1 pyridoxamine 5'-phosphate oxidase family protein [Primorskyibacter aestuariivivens]